MEISRTIAAILRLIYTGPRPNIELLDKLLEHPTTIEAALWEMVKQEQYPVVASEGWFALALLSREPRGANRVASMLDRKLLEKVFEEETGRDRDNAGVLVVELKKNSSVDVVDLVNLFLKRVDIAGADLTKIE